MRRWFVLSALLCGCAASPQQQLAELSQARLARAQELNAAQLAPTSYQSYLRASAQAKKSKQGSAQRADLASEARLWLEAAISEAEQLALSRRRLEVEREAVQNDERYLELEQQRLAAEREVDRREAGAVALLEAERSLARAATLPAQRIKLAPDEVARAALALIAQADALLALSIDPAEQAAREQLAASLGEARAQLGKAPDRALELADRALFAGLALAGKQRAAQVDQAQKESLREALALAGATVAPGDTGLRASLPKTAAASAPRTVARLCSIAQAYPHGTVQLAHANPALARAFAQQGCTGQRFSVAKGPAGELLSLTFSAY